MAVQKTYTEEMVSKYLNERKAAGATLRELAENDFHGKVTYGDIHRALNGVFPKGKKKRAAMNLAPMELTEACPECGGIHKHKTCPRTRNGKPQHYTVSLGYIPEGERDQYRRLTPGQRRRAMDNFIKEMED